MELLQPAGYHMIGIRLCFDWSQSLIESPVGVPPLLHVDWNASCCLLVTGQTFTSHSVANLDVHVGTVKYSNL